MLFTYKEKYYFIKFKKSITMLQKSFFSKAILLLTFFLNSIAAFAQDFSLIKDINPTPSQSSFKNSLSNSVLVGDILYFAADDGVNGTELWRTDGTSAGTFLVSNIETNNKSSSPRNLVVAKGTIFFLATTGANGTELWKSDGSDAGTVIVTDLGKDSLNSTIVSSISLNNVNLTAFKDKVYFNTADGVYESDGSSDGTTLILSATGAPMSFEVFNDLLYISDGTKLYTLESGGSPTLLVEEGTKGYSVTGSKMQIKTTTQGLMFTGSNSLWTTTGTLLETRKVFASSTTSPKFDLNRSVSTDTKFFFLYDAKDTKDNFGLQVWVTDGTELGTKLTKQIGNNSLATNYAYLTAINNIAYFRFSNGGANNLELWRTDGTAAGTFNLTTFADAKSLSIETNIGGMVIEGGKIKFIGQYADGLYVCRTDGTVAGTVKSFKIGNFSASGATLPFKLQLVGTTAVFSYNTEPSVGAELYRLGAPPFSISLVVSSKVKCNGDKTGIIEVQTIGGFGAVAYKWSSGQTTAKISDLGVGKYTVTVTNGSGATLVESYNMTEPAKLAAVVNASSSPTGQKVGRASALANGGVGPYTYNWNTTPIQASSAIKNLAPGTYTVTITDTNQCKLVKDAVVGVLEIKFTVNKPILCNGDKSGEVAVSVPEWTAGTNTYVWSDGTKGATASNLAAGTYNLTLTNATNTSVTATYTLVEPKKMTITSTITDEVNGNGKGKIEVIVAGGTAPYQYSWDKGTGENLSKGSYALKVTDLNGCSISEVFVVNNAAVSIVQTGVIKCNGDKTGALDATTAGATSYLWNTGATSPTITGLGAGTYTPTITMPNGTKITATKTITEPALLVATATSKDATGTQKNGSATAVAIGGTFPYNFTWNTTPPQTTAEATGLAAGDYVVTVSDANGCKTTITVKVKSNVGTNELATDLGLLVYPNPASNVLTINVKNAIAESYNYQVIDVLGRVQTTGQWTSQQPTINVATLPNGTYFLALQSEKSGVAVASFLIKN
jgi:ELWxxDGT repeat protein